MNKFDKTVLLVDGKKPNAFFDDYSGRYFYSDVETVKRVVNNLNRKLPEEMYITLKEFMETQ